MVENSLHELIRPVLMCVCDYYLFKQHGVEEKEANVVAKLRGLFADIRRAIEADDFLKRDYLQIEKPLVFFVDYFIKESGFTFSRDYEPMARMYNELSGDDKFFDILEAYLSSANTSKEVIEAFYMMLSLGFDGAYKRDPKDVIPFIYRCREKLDSGVDFKSDFITPLVQPDDEERSEKNKKELNSFVLKKNFLLILIAVTVLTLVINMVSVHKNISAFEDIVEQTVDAASPYKNMLITNDRQSVVLPSKDTDAE
ncbi:MAG: DotU family type IV/VI secretion system protein [Succinivibrio sp.]